MEAEPIPGREDEPRSAEALLAELETGLISAQRSTYVEAIRANDPGERRTAAIAYRDAAEAVVEQLQGEEYRYAQILLTLAVGRIWQEAGHIDRYQEELADVRMCAEQEGFGDILDLIKSF